MWQQNRPYIQPLSGETFVYRSAIVGDEARLDIKARGFWNPTQDAFLDVRVFHPNALCYRSKDTATIHKQHEAAKKENTSSNVEHGVFTPLVFSTTCRQHGKGRNNVLQKTSRHVIKKTRRTILYCHGMDKISAKFCHHSISNYVHTRNQICICKTNLRRESDPGSCRRSDP